MTRDNSWSNPTIKILRKESKVPIIGSHALHMLISRRQPWSWVIGKEFKLSHFHMIAYINSWRENRCSCNSSMCRWCQSCHYLAISNISISWGLVLKYLNTNVMRELTAIKFTHIAEGCENNGYRISCSHGWWFEDHDQDHGVYFKAYSDQDVLFVMKS